MKSLLWILAPILLLCALAFSPRDVCCQCCIGLGTWSPTTPTCTNADRGVNDNTGCSVALGGPCTVTGSLTATKCSGGPLDACMWFNFLSGNGNYYQTTAASYTWQQGGLSGQWGTVNIDCDPAGTDTIRVHFMTTSCTGAFNATWYKRFDCGLCPGGQVNCPI